ncbi:sulfatase-like hydrolase/transferase [Microbulbifer yueqingensis]|uniref:Membrane-anchored protein YejM, alkaline phosphatase superfamily n=1 Tax=Microbulbifer yueqingensis TaxID=658219 RepID=A0A1G9A9G0_9GAMM|nr:sulfatase-like hydrolase/transferase [Microbulbifer yueqingensis]SDK23947.1 Membrane-anchored protein YejM, alkaline phosphatase superfamily [Microbulbifer yueqingensis]
MILKLLHKNQIVLILGALLSIFFLKVQIKLPEHLKFELEAQLLSPEDAVAAIYCDDGKGYRSSHMLELPYSPEYRVADATYVFKGRIPCGIGTKKIRFDPLWAEGELILKSFKLRTYRWFEIELDERRGAELTIINGIDKVQSAAGGIKVTSSGQDPIIELTDNVQGYFVVRNRDVFIGILILTPIFAALLKAAQLALSFILVRGEKIELFRQGIENRVDAVISIFTNYIRGSVEKPRDINFLAYLFAFAISIYGSWLFLGAIYPGVSVAYASAFIAAQVSVCFFLLLIAAAGWLLRDTARSWFFPGLAILFAICYVADAQLFRLNGMHISHGLQIMLDGGIQNFQKNLEFTKLSKPLLVAYQIVCLFLILSAFVLAFILGRLKRGFTIKISWKNCISLFVVLISIAYVEQWFSARTKSHSLWSLEQSDIPTYLTFIKAKDFIIEYGVKVKPYPVRGSTEFPQNLTEKVKKRNVYLFILESVRSDVITENVAPNLYKFKGEALNFKKAIANGNATHYGWYSIVNSRIPLYWDTYKSKEHKAGSESLRALKNAGYEIKVHSSKDLSYLSADETMFGSDLQLIDYITKHIPGSIPAIDISVTDTLIQSSINTDVGRASFNIVFWDSTHYPYRWPKTMGATFEPYAGSEESGVSLNSARELAIKNNPMIFNRYKNSIRFSDKLFGRFVNELKRNGLYEDAIIVVVGDHGQQFMEHNYLMHGRTLFSEDLHIPLYIKAPGYSALSSKKVASQVDIMPTILDLLGVGKLGNILSDGQSLVSKNTAGSFGVAAAAGFKNTPFRYVVEIEDWKLVFDLNRNDPLSSNKLYVKNIYDAGDREFIPGGGSKDDYSRFLEDKFGRELKNLPFLDLRSGPL